MFLGCCLWTLGSQTAVGQVTVKRLQLRGSIWQCEEDVEWWHTLHMAVRDALHS